MDGPTHQSHGYDETVAQGLLAREAARCRALLAREFDLLDDLLDSELLHTHSNGEIHDKQAYLTHARGPTKLLAIARGTLRVRIEGGLALMSGTMSTTQQPAAPIAAVIVHTQVLQVWTLGAKGWRLLAFQGTRLAAPPKRG